MCIICKGEYKEGMEELNCSWCPKLTEIPHIKGLEVLDCNGCQNLTEIPNIEGLKVLYCCGCSKLTEIPNIKRLEELYCWGCPKLTKIPNIKGLKELECWGCPWISYKNNEYKENIQKLITLQRWFKVKYKKLKLKQALLYVRNPKLFSWFYAPNKRGGRIHKKNMKKFCENLKR